MVFNNRGSGQSMARRDRMDNSHDINAFLGDNTDFKGVLVFEGTVRIDGKLEGEISSEDTLVVGEHAIVNAEINVGSIIISGKISGDITAKSRVDIKSTGEVYGNIQTPILTIEEGVVFQGTCDMRKGNNQCEPIRVLPDKAPEPVRAEDAKDSSEDTLNIDLD